jgi:hypothetical protein
VSYPCCEKMSGPIWLNGRYCRPVCPEHGYQEEPAPVERSPINWQARAEAAEAQVARLREALRIAVVLVEAAWPHAPMLKHLRAALEEPET